MCTCFDIEMIITSHFFSSRKRKGRHVVDPGEKNHSFSRAAFATATMAGFCVSQSASFQSSFSGTMTVPQTHCRNAATACCTCSSVGAFCGASAMEPPSSENAMSRRLTSVFEINLRYTPHEKSPSGLEGLLYVILFF